MDIELLQKKSLDTRKEVLKMLNTAGSGHTGGSLGITDILVALYFSIMHHDPKNPNWSDRDRLILSNGHTCPALYSVLSLAGYFPKEKLKTLRKLGSPLQGHPERERLPGIETTSGPLGSGLAQAVGMALASRMDGKHTRIFCIASDGEHDEGNHWEAVMIGAKYKLSNLTLFVDRNNIQIDGPTEKVLPLNPLSDKYKSFNWNVIEINGHNFNEIIESVKKARQEYTKPTVIIAKTIPGYGVSFMENNYLWHGKVPNESEYLLALKELEDNYRKVGDIDE